jgi:hypothetical protein
MRAARREADQQQSNVAEHEAGHHNSDAVDPVGQLGRPLLWQRVICRFP